MSQPAARFGQNLNGLFLAFALPFFLRHGDEGREFVQIDHKTIQMPKENSLPCDSYFLQPITADWP